MPIYTPTGFLDITNATLRTSNLEAENFKLNGGNIYVTTDFTTPPTLQLIAGFGNVTSNTIQFSNDTTGLVTTANVSVGKDLTVAGDINFSGTFNQNGAPFASSPWTTTGADLSYTTGNVSVGKDLTMTGTGVLTVPSGTTGQRPVNLVNGMIRYNTETGSVEAYTTSSGWGAISAPPSITSVSPISVQGAHTGTQTFVVQGTGINTGSTVELEGVDGNRYSVFNTTTPAAAGYQISFQMGVFGAANGYDPLQTPYKIRVANAMGIAAVGTATISLLPPTITSLSNNTLLASATGSTTITVTGTGFTSSMTGTDKVQVLGVDGTTLYPVDSVAFVDATSLTFKLSATGAVLGSPQLTNRPYTVKVTGGAGLTATSTATISLLPPTITSLSNNTLLASATGSTTITVTGTGFTSSMTGTDKVQVLGVDGTTLYPVDSVAFVDATSLTFKLSATGAVLGSPQLTNRPYTVKVTGGAGLTATSTATISLLPPTITSLSNNTLLASATGSHIITVTGTGFTSSMASGNDVQVLGVDGTTLYPVDSVVVAGDGLSLTFKLSATGAVLGSGQLTNRPYKVVATIGGGLTATSTATIGFSGLSWTSPAAGATLTFSTLSSANNTELAATDEVGGSGVTYSIPANNLPSPLTLNGITGAITGIIGAVTVAGGVSVTFRATDNVTGTTLDRTFSIVGMDGLFAFTSHTFTRAAGDVRFGPTFDQMKTAYNSTVWYNTTAWFNQVSGKQGFQLWTIPKTGTYRITAKGGQGTRTAGNGAYSNSPGNGANIRADIAFTVGTKIVIIVGQAGEYPTGVQKNNTGGGGGGATWILKESFTTANDQVYMVAGAGGGAGSPNYNVGQAGHANGSSQGNFGYGGAAGGTFGGASGGAGWLGNGTASSNGSSGISEGIRPAAGAMGGGAGGSSSYPGYESTGGFGGGGGNGIERSGGGAGATGGAGGEYNAISYGGISYIITTATNRTFTGTHTAYEGSVYIQAPGTF